MSALGQIAELEAAVRAISLGRVLKVGEAVGNPRVDELHTYL